MELLSQILIILVALALSLSCVSFWIAIKMMREIDVLKEKMELLLRDIVVLKENTNVLMSYITVLKTSLESELIRKGMISRR